MKGVLLFVLAACAFGCGGQTGPDEGSPTGGRSSGSGGMSSGSGGAGEGSGGSLTVESCDEGLIDCSGWSDCGCDGGFESCGVWDIHCEQDAPNRCVCDPSRTIDRNDCRFPSMEFKCSDRIKETGLPWMRWCVCDESWREEENPCPPKSEEYPECRLDCDGPTIEESTHCACLAC